MSDQDLYDRDLAVMQAMIDNVDHYLASDATRWDLGTAGMPPMTLGGILMRRERLGQVDDRLTAEQRRVRDELNARFDGSLVEQVVRFEQRAHAELHARLREWTNYLRDLPSRSAAQPELYAYVADTRVVIGVLIDKLREAPYKLEAHIPADVAALDQRLMSLWIKGPFIWNRAWEPVYGPERYWYLYGGPRSA